MIQVKEIFAKVSGVSGLLSGCQSIEKPLNAVLKEFETKGYTIRNIIYTRDLEKGGIHSAIVEYETPTDDTQANNAPKEGE